MIDNLIAPLKVRDFCLLFSGQMISTIGALTSRFGPVILFPVSGAMMLGTSAFGWLQREVRKL